MDNNNFMKVSEVAEAMGIPATLQCSFDEDNANKVSAGCRVHF